MYAHTTINNWKNISGRVTRVDNYYSHTRGKHESKLGKRYKKWAKESPHGVLNTLDPKKGKKRRKPSATN